MGLFVALYLILLAFFIILASMSTEAVSRASAAMESVSQTFSKTKAPTGQATPTEMGQDDALLQGIEQSFALALEIEGRFPSGEGRVFEVQFPADRLFEKGSFRVQPGMEPLLDQIAGLLRERKGDHRLEVAFMFGSGEGSVSRLMTRSQEYAVRRASSLAQHLRTEGVNAGTFSAGFIAIPEGEILAVFRSAPAKDEMLDLSMQGSSGWPEGAFGE